VSSEMAHSSLGQEGCSMQWVLRQRRNFVEDRGFVDLGDFFMRIATGYLLP